MAAIAVEDEFAIVEATSELACEGTSAIGSVCIIGDVARSCRSDLACTDS